MVSLQKYFEECTLADVPSDHVRNAEDLLMKVNLLEEAWIAHSGEGFEQTSGYRTMHKHVEIYTKKGVPLEKVPKSSNHLDGEAIDIRDRNNQKKTWLKEGNSWRMKALGLYAEEGTDGWLHLQSQPPKSGRRWFLP